MVAAALLGLALLAQSAMAQQDVLTDAGTNRAGVANGVLTIPVFVKDVLGTSAGRDQPPAGQITNVEFGMTFEAAKIAGCLAAVGNCDFVESGVLSGVKPASSDPLSNCTTAATGCFFRTITLSANSLTYTVSTRTALPTSADPVGDLLGYVRVKLAAGFTSPTTATQNGAAGYLGGPGPGSSQPDTSSETVANGKLVVNDTAPQKSIDDIDANGAVDPFTDGILLVRRMLGASGTALTQSAVLGTNRITPADVVRYLDSINNLQDVDGNNTVDPFTDGILTVRFMLGATGTALTASATGPGCTRCDSASIINYLNLLIQQ